MPNRLNINLLMRTLSEILSDKYGANITMTAVPKLPEVNEEETK